MIYGTRSKRQSITHYPRLLGMPNILHHAVIELYSNHMAHYGTAINPGLSKYMAERCLRRPARIHILLYSHL
jgi:hypothetical protein